MAARGRTFRRLTLLLSGALVVHQLRYVAASHAASEGALTGPTHAYLTAVGTLALLLATLAAARLVHGLAGSHPASGERPSSLLLTWVSVSSALAGVFVAQELVEVALASGPAPGLTAVLADGGWTGPVFAVLVGGVVALADRGAAAALAAPPASAVTRRPVSFPAPSNARPPRVDRVAEAVERALGARGPPLARR